MGDADQTPTGTTNANAAWNVISLLFAGIISWGGIGLLLDWWLGTNFFVAIGILLGSAGALFLVIRRYGQMASDQDTDGKNL